MKEALGRYMPLYEVRAQLGCISDLIRTNKKAHSRHYLLPGGIDRESRLEW